METLMLLAGFFLLNFYIVSSIRFWLKTAGVNTKLHHWDIILAVLFCVTALVPIGGAFLPDSSLKWNLQEWGNLWHGILGYGALLLLISRIIWMIASRSMKGIVLKRTAAVTLAVCLIADLGINIYGCYHAQTLIVKNYDVQIDKPNDEVPSLKIVLLADLHLSVNSHIETIRDMVREVNAEDPDLIVFAGDIFTSSYYGLRNPDQYSEALSELRAKYGVYAVFGNHDVAETLFGGFPISDIRDALRPQEMNDFISASGITLLSDETVHVAGVQIAGRIDGERAGDGTDNRLKADELLQNCDTSKPIIVLEHEPWEFKQLANSGADLALCGHTHNGQIFPGNLAVPFFNENGYGMKITDGITSIVTSGIGYYGPPIRVGTDSEITVVNLTFKEQS